MKRICLLVISLILVVLIIGFCPDAEAGFEGNSNTFYGIGAGPSTIGDNDQATFIGYRAGYSNTTGTDNTFIGYSSGYSNTTGIYNIFLGNFAGYSNTTGNYNIFHGPYAGHLNTTGTDNTFIGYRSGYSNTYGSFNTFLGKWAGFSNTTGDSNTFLGFVAGSDNTTGNSNTYIGRDAGRKNTTGYQNTFLGFGAGYDNTTGNSNTYIGRDAGRKNTTGYQNTFLGTYAGNFNTTGNNNTFVGVNAGLYTTTGHSNTHVGLDAGYANTTGNSNTLLGNAAGLYNATGSGNVFLGYRAGFSETGSNRLYIDNSDTSNPLIYGEFDNRILTINGNLEVVAPNNGLIYLTNTTTDNTTKVSRMVLDHYSTRELPVYLFGSASTATNNFVAFGGGNTIGNAATQIDLFTGPNTTTPVGYPRLTIIGNGYVGIGIQDPLYPLEMASGARVTTGGAWTNASSREYKDNIEALATEEALVTLKELNPVKFAYKRDLTEKHVGFIAEEAPELVATKDRKGLSPMDIVAVLTKVVQEQQKMVQEQQRTISTLREELNELKEKVR